MYDHLVPTIVHNKTEEASLTLNSLICLNNPILLLDRRLAEALLARYEWHKSAEGRESNGLPGRIETQKRKLKGNQEVPGRMGMWRFQSVHRNWDYYGEIENL